MNATFRNTAWALLATLTIVSLTSTTTVAAGPQPLLVAPGEPNGPNIFLPKFGFSSFSIYGVGQRVTHVRWNGLAAQLGLEPGDVILSMNGYPLTYDGSWNDALYQAVANGGWVQLKIRDVNTGFVAYRQTFVGLGGNRPIVQHYQVGYPDGPVTSHVLKNPHNGGINVKKIAKLIDKLND